MTFELSPNLPPPPVLATKVLQSSVPVAHRVSFSMLLGAETNSQSLLKKGDTSPDGPVDEDVKKAENALDPGLDGDPVVIETALQALPKQVERAQKTLLESTFNPAINADERIGQTGRPGHLARPDPSDSALLLSQTAKVTGAATPPTAPIETAGLATLPVREAVAILAAASQAFPRSEKAENQKKSIDAPTTDTADIVAKATAEVRTTIASLPANINDQRFEGRETSAKLTEPPQQDTPKPAMQTPAAAPQALTLAPAILLATQTQHMGTANRNGRTGIYGDVPLVQGSGEAAISSNRLQAPEAGNRPSQPQHVARIAAHQMAVAVSQIAAGSTELVLTQKELGQIRMVISTQDSGITVVIHAERPETTDLLRRHIETLSAEFKNMGYNTTNFTFGQDQKGGAAPESGSAAQLAALQEDIIETPQPAGPGALSGLDLRL